VSSHTLTVHDGGARVGTLAYESLDERFSFEYDASWCARPHAYCISPHIPMFADPPPSGTLRRFLDNLLPEGRALDVVVTTHKISKNNLYGLIRELGRETAGALSFTAQAEAPNAAETTRREITRQELAMRIAEREQLPFSVWDGRVRMSIAGYQDKLAVYLDGEQMFLVEGQLASTHILKPETAENRLPLLVANEHYCMRLAGRLGLCAAPVTIVRLPAPVLVIERFDRVRTDTGVRRLHIIDACQALNVPVAYKYERNFGSGRDVQHIRDGVSFERLFSISEYTVRKAVTQRDLLRWALYQYLIGNADAHGKNVSFFCTPEGLSLAPFYDLVSIVPYPGLDHAMAMAYGDEFVLGDVRPDHWAQFAHNTRTPSALLKREMRRMGKMAASEAEAQAEEAVYDEQERTFLKGIARFVEQQGRKLVEAAEFHAI
jgi:serine/threonine-protein kinase HipA